MKKNQNKKIIGGCLTGTIAVLLCILGIRGISAETEKEASIIKITTEEIEEEQLVELQSLIEMPEYQSPNAAEQQMAEVVKQGDGLTAVPEEIQTENEIGTEGEAAMEERIVFQPDFYYEPINEEVKSRIYGLSYKEDCTVPYDELRYVRVRYINFNGSDKTGELICNKAIAQDLVEIFYELYLAQYPIEQIRLIDEYSADDLLSMKDNNTSCFNYRVVEGSTKLSKHARGLAIDINPFYNPYVDTRDGRVSPEESDYYADRTKTFAYKIDKNDLCYKLFTDHGFFWGGNWKTTKDYQHFQKEI